jgi:predicted PurR-regulated permease PerM
MNYINKHIYSIILVLAGIAFLAFCFPFLTWILFGGVVSLAVKPLQNKFLIQKLKINKTLSVYIVFLSILLVFIPFILSFLTFFSEGRKVSENIKTSETIEAVDRIITNTYFKFPALNKIADRSKAISYIKKGAQKIVEPLIKLASQLFLSLPSLFLGLFIFFSSLYYFIYDSKLIYEFVTSLEIIEHKELDQLVNILQLSCQSTLFAAIITGAVQSLIITVTAASLGISFFLTIFFISMFFAQIPIVGTLPITLGLIIYFYSIGNVFSAIVMVVAGVVSGLSDNVIRPWVLSRYDSLHPFAGLIASLGALIIIGPIGVLVGPVITLLFVKVLKQQYKKSDG